MVQQGMAKEAAITFTLPDELDIRAAIPLAAQLGTMRGADLTLDLSQVERVGAQCLQVLLSAAATWEADGAELVLHQPSPAFTEAVTIAGLDLSQFATALPFSFSGEE